MCLKSHSSYLKIVVSEPWVVHASCRTSSMEKSDAAGRVRASDWWIRWTRAGLQHRDVQNRGRWVGSPFYFKGLGANSSSRIVMGHFTASVPEWNEGRANQSQWTASRLGGILLRGRSWDHLGSHLVTAKSQFSLKYVGQESFPWSETHKAASAQQHRHVSSLGLQWTQDIPLPNEQCVRGVWKKPTVHRSGKSLGFPYQGATATRRAP